MLTKREVLIIKLLGEKPMTASELYSALGALTEGQKAGWRKVLLELRRKGLVERAHGELYRLTEKGMKILECIHILGE